MKENIQESKIEDDGDLDKRIFIKKDDKGVDSSDEFDKRMKQIFVS